MKISTRDINNNNNNIVENTSSIKPENNNNNGGGWFSFFRRNNNNNAQSQEKVTESTEPAKIEVKTENKIEPKSDNITIKVEQKANAPSSSTIKPNPYAFNEINIYEDEPSLKDIPLDVYDDSIKLEPQNLKNVKYHSIDEHEIENGNLNNINLYESTPESKKTIFRKIKEIYRETVRLIKLCIKSIFAFIWAIFGGIITGIFTFFRSLFFNTLLSFIKFVIKSKTSRQTRDVDIDQLISTDKDLWDINNMLITKPLYKMV